MKLSLVIEFLPEKALARLFVLQNERRETIISIELPLPNIFAAQLHVLPELVTLNLNQVGQAFVNVSD